MLRLRARHVAFLAVALAACGSETAEQIDPTATYDVYGERFEPGVAVPAPAVFAEPEAYVGRTVIIEGMASGDCAETACVAAITSGDGGRIEVFLPTEGGVALDVPTHVLERRIVVNGTLVAGRSNVEGVTPDTPNRPSQGYGDTSHAGADPIFSLNATGFMVEKVRP